MARKSRSLEELNRVYNNDVQKKIQLSSADEIEKAITNPTIQKPITTENNYRSGQQRRQEEVEFTKRILVIGLMVLALLVCMFVIYRRNNSNKSGELKSVVLTAEEQEKWDSLEIQEGQFYIELNGKIEVKEQRANIRLINPIYSAYTISIQIWDKQDENNLLYESEKLMPGTVLEMIRLSKELTADEYECVVNYIIYDEAGNEKGSRPVDVRLINKNTQ